MPEKLTADSPQIAELLDIAREFPQGINAKAAEERLGVSNRWARVLLNTADDFGVLSLVPGSRPHRWIVPPPADIRPSTPIPREQERNIPAKDLPPRLAPAILRTAPVTDEEHAITGAAHAILARAQGFLGVSVPVGMHDARLALLRLGLVELRRRAAALRIDDNNHDGEE